MCIQAFVWNYCSLNKKIRAPSFGKVGTREGWKKGVVRMTSFRRTTSQPKTKILHYVFFAIPPEAFPSSLLLPRYSHTYTISPFSISAILTTNVFFSLWLDTLCQYDNNFILPPENSQYPPKK
jgi:hypothetical protein